MMNHCMIAFVGTTLFDGINAPVRIASDLPDMDGAVAQLVSDPLRQSNSRVNQETMHRTLVKYALLQVPGQIIFVLILFLLKDWFSLPPWLVILLILLWIAKDAALYPLVRHAYGPSDSDRAQSMVGRRGAVRERLDPSGYIELGGELWRAEIRQGGVPIEAGKIVEVIERNGLTLIVEPVEDET